MLLYSTSCKQVLGVDTTYKYIYLPIKLIKFYKIC